MQNKLFRTSAVIFGLSILAFTPNSTIAKTTSDPCEKACYGKNETKASCTRCLKKHTHPTKPGPCETECGENGHFSDCVFCKAEQICKKDPSKCPKAKDKGQRTTDIKGQEASHRDLPKPKDVTGSNHQDLGRR